MVKVYFRNIAIIIMALVSMVSLSYIILSDFINDSADIDDVFSTVTIWSLISLFCPVFILISKIAAIINPNTRIMMPKTDNLKTLITIFTIFCVLSARCLLIIVFNISYAINNIGEMSLSHSLKSTYSFLALIAGTSVLLSVLYYPAQAAYRVRRFMKNY